MNTAKRLVRACIPRSVRNWLRSPAKTAEWTWGEIKHGVGANRTVQMRPDWSLSCHPLAYRFAYHAQDNDPEQAAEFNGFIANCQPGMVLFDIGAHFGLFSLAALHYGGLQAQAVAVDPSPVAVRFLNIQARLNHVVDRLQIVQASVGDQEGWQKMVSVGVLASGYYVAPAKDHSASEVTQTMAVTLDQLAERYKILPTHIKIDVEGYEAAVLRGGQQLLSQTPAPILFIELHNEISREGGGDPADPLMLLRDYGYRTFTVDGFPINDNAILKKPLIRIIAKRGINGE